MAEEECSRYSVTCYKLGQRLAEDDYSPIYATSPATAIAGAHAEIERWCVINRDKFRPEGEVATLYWEVIEWTDTSRRRVGRGTKLADVPNKYAGAVGVGDCAGLPGFDDEGNAGEYHIWGEEKIREAPLADGRGWRTDYDVRMSLCEDRLIRGDVDIGTLAEQVERCTCNMCLHVHINLLRDKMNEIAARMRVAEDRRALAYAIIGAERAARDHEEETA